MKKIVYSLLVALVTAVVMASAPAFAEEGHQGKGHKGMRHNMQSFADIDTDSDGGVSPDEFSAHQAGCKMKHRK